MHAIRQFTAATVGFGAAVHALRGSHSQGDRLTHDSIRCGAGRSRSAGVVRGAKIKLSDQEVTCRRCITITESDAIWAGK